MKSDSFVSEGYFRGQYHVDLSVYTGPDFSKHCVVFPGQSSAFPGMMNEQVSSSEVCLARFAEADALAESLGLPPVSRYILSPGSLSPEELSKLRNPALFTLEVALFDDIVKKGLRPSAITAHSFGEYAATVASGIAKFADVFKIVVMRDRFSPAPKTLGLMLVAGCSAVDAARALEGIEHFVSNFNSPKQVVISVKPTAEKEAHDRLKAARIAAKTLQEMPQPYHTPWMQPVARELASSIANASLKFSAPKIRVVSSVGVEILEVGSAEISALRLSRQLCEPVRFTEQIAKCVELKAVNFVEVGPSEICSQFIKATLGDTFYKITPLSRYFKASETAAPKKRRLRTEKSNLLGALSKVIATVTGYSIDEISVEQNFQEDLGIDSIRKAEIVFKFMDSMKSDANSSELMQVNLSKLKNLEDVIEHFAAANESAGARGASVEAEFDRFEETWIPEPITNFERMNFDEGVPRAVRFINLAEAVPQDFGDEPCGSIVAFCLSAEGGRECLSAWIDAIQAIARRDTRWPVRVALLAEPGADAYLSGLDGVFRSWIQENGFEAYRRVEAAGFSRAELSDLLEEEFLDPRFTDVRYTRENRFVKKWSPVAEALSSDELRMEPIVVSLGGSRGIGAVILERLVAERPRATLYVLGRSQESSPGVAATLAKLRAGGTSVSYIQTDVNHRLAEVLLPIAALHGGIDLVLNGAGQELSRSLATKSKEEIWLEFAGKVAPITALVAQAKTLKLGHLVNYSSVAAAFGNTGQSIYALGNQVQVALGEHLARTSETKVTSLVLPPWENLGMTASPLILNGLKAAGVAMMKGEVGARLVVQEALGAANKQIAFLNKNDLRAYDCQLTDRAAWEGLFARPVVAEVPIRISKLNRRDQPYLNDHVINGNVIYPGSSALALMTFAAYHYLKSVPVIENFEVRSFLKPELETSACDLTITRKAGGRIGLQISSRQVVHFVCEASVPDFATELPLSSVFTEESLIEVEPLYGNEHITLGPHFRLASRLSVSKNEELMQSSRNDQMLRYTSTLAFDRLAQWFESALQVMGCQLLWKTKNYWVPNRIGKIACRFDRRLTNELNYRVEIAELAQGHALATARAMNASSETIFELQQVEDIEVGADLTSGQFKMKGPREVSGVEAYV